MVRQMQSTGRRHDSPAVGQLLQELEVLCRTLTVQTQAFPHKETGKTALLASRVNKILSRFPGAKPRDKEGGGRARDAGEKKRSSLWNWKPLRALAHIGRQHLASEFSLRVHSVEGLAANFNGVKTRPAGINQGLADFGETIYHKCSVYGGSGSQGMRYEFKFFGLYVSSLGMEERKLCRHKVDLSGMLPETLGGAVLEAEERSSSWTTNFKLTAMDFRGEVLIATLG